MKWFLTLFLLVFLLACQKKDNSQRAFYYWKSQLELSPKDSIFLKQLNCKRLYIKYFDVDFDADRQQILPIARIVFPEKIPNFHVVPCVYITVAAVKNLKKDQIDDLAQKILKKIRAINQKNKLQVAEIQIDCDWTDSTKENYFGLLEALQKNNKTLISATLRLHQVKYAKKRGIPPVKKALLMCYNVESVKKYESPNSIFQVELIKNYLQKLENYPLALDVALPVFSWGVVFTENKQFGGLLNELHQKDLPDSLFSAEGNFYTARKDLYLKNKFLKKDTQIRLEKTQSPEIEEVSRFISTKIRPQNVILFHFSPALFDNYQEDELEKIYEHFD